ncbi:MAG TPA: choice-of-anchor tandem repeat GloVer-containing protein [Terriglobales bacterium]|nr:choice-of-anchor tandem repeat GloVer-containing protein [Terriglobales bacterium]
MGGDWNCNYPYGCGVLYKLDTAGTETVLHIFSGSPDGVGPAAPLVRDKAGNMYGTTGGGGSVGYGTVFKIDTAGKETVLYNFTGGSDGCNPYQGLVVGQFGALYGTAFGCGSSDAGTIFKVDRAGKFTLLHGFIGSDGRNPLYGHLTMDKSGNLYGLTEYGGAYGYGVLYKLTKRGTTVLHSFSYGTSDGCWTYGSVVQDKAGNFYGTTYRCGSYGYGTIWKVSQKDQETVLHNFDCTEAIGPVAGVVLDSKGNLYGVTSYGGADCGSDGYGVLYELSASGTLTVLHTFGGSDGIYPDGEVLRTAKGTLYGTTSMGGGANGAGTVWSYVP